MKRNTSFLIISAIAVPVIALLTGRWFVARQVRRNVAELFALAETGPVNTYDPVPTCWLTRAGATVFPARTETWPNVPANRAAAARRAVQNRPEKRLDTHCRRRVFSGRQAGLYLDWYNDLVHGAGPIRGGAG